MQLEAFVDVQLSVTACPTSIWVWLAETETETFFAGLLVELLAGETGGALAGVLAAAAVTGVLAAAVTGVLAAVVAGVLATVDEPAAVEPDAAALAVVAGALLTGVPRLLVELAGVTAVPPPPPPPHAASVVAMRVKMIERVIAEESIRCMVLDSCG